MQGSWHVLRGKVQEKWGKLTNADLDVIEGRYEQLVGRLEQAYGKSREQAEKDVDHWLREMDAA
jgi:uncharacterized protein YjbJ (UPF0337 family)